MLSLGEEGINIRHIIYKIRGYSIVEIAVAIIILSLIFAGIAAARSFVDQSLLRAIIADVNRFSSAIDNFKDAYTYYPGDYPQAFRRWGAGSPTCTDTTGTNTSCNGDGDGIIEFATGTNAPIEDLLVWRHLYLSGFILGDFTGATDGGTARYLEGVNAPKSGFEKCTYAFHDLTSTQYGFLGKVIHHGGVLSGTASIPGAAVVSASEAYYIDDTMDDGLASKGKVIAIRADGVASGCVDNPLAANPVYDFSSEEKTCRLIFFYDKK